MIVGVIDSLKSTIGILLAIVGYRIIRNGWSSWILIGAVALILALTVVPAVTEWTTTGYRLGADSLEFRTGLFSRKRRTIGYATIHAIDIASPVYFQPFGVVRLTITAAGSDADITLDAVPVALRLELESLRSASHAVHADDDRCGVHDSADASVSRAASSASSASSATPATDAAATRTTAPAPEPTPTPAPAPAPTSSDADHPVFRASMRDILLFAVTDLGFLAAALAVYAAFDKVGDLIPRAWMRTATQSVSAIVAHGVLSIMLLALGCMIALMIVSIVSALLRFYGFEVWRRNDDLVVVRGLFTRRTMTLPVSRIQTITIRQSLLRRPFHLCSVSLGLSSAVGDDDANDGSDSANILPVVSARRVVALLRAILPEWDVRDDLPIRRTGRGLTRYYVTLPSVLGAVATVAAVMVVTVQGWTDDCLPWMIPAVPFALCAWWTASRWLRSRTEGYALMDDTADGGTLPHRITVTGARGLTRFTLVTRRSRVQAVIRETALWRASRGIETLVMPLFVTNDADELRFRFIRRSDGDHLAAWLESA
nr:PH domain-containing protein [Bifidobacterium aerophilum]